MLRVAGSLSLLWLSSFCLLFVFFLPGRFQKPARIIPFPGAVTNPFSSDFALIRHPFYYSVRADFRSNTTPFCNPNPPLEIWGLPNLGVAFCGVKIIRTIVFWRVFWVSCLVEIS